MTKDDVVYIGLKQRYFNEQFLIQNEIEF